MKNAKQLIEDFISINNSETSFAKDIHGNKLKLPKIAFEVKQENEDGKSKIQFLVDGEPIYFGESEGGSEQERIEYLYESMNNFILKWGVNSLMQYNIELKKSK